MQRLKKFFSKLSFNRRAAGAFMVVLAAVFGVYKFTGNNTYKNSAMITNRAGTSGGTGIILRSSKSESTILTNDHVCKLLLKENSGSIQTVYGTFQPTSVTESELSDLCMVTVADNLYTTTRISEIAPTRNDEASISGHPALMPTVLSKGQFSGRALIKVTTGFRQCTEAEQKNPDTALICIFLGGFPVMKSYESVLVTATIMPGSSGSGVYDSSNNLAGVVFAGSGELGYAWTVPYEQLIYFIYTESRTLRRQNLTQNFDLFPSTEESKRLLNARIKCREAKDEAIIDVCNLLKRDNIYGN